MFFIIPILLCFVFEHETINTTKVLAVFDFLFLLSVKNLQNSDCPFHFLFKEIHLRSRQLRRLAFLQTFV